MVLHAVSLIDRYCSIIAVYRTGYGDRAFGIKNSIPLVPRYVQMVGNVFELLFAHFENGTAIYRHDTSSAKTRRYLRHDRRASTPDHGRGGFLR